MACFYDYCRYNKDNGKSNYRKELYRTMAKTKKEWEEIFKAGYRTVSFRQIAEYLHDTKSPRFDFYKAEAAEGKHISQVRNEFYEEFFPQFKPEKKKKVSISAFEFDD